MRRSLATLILTVSLWAGSVAWSGFLSLNTVLDPSRSERVANTLYEDEAVRDQLVDNIANALEASLPEGVPVPREQVEKAAYAALDSPVVKDQIVGALVQSHQAFLGEGDPPESIDAGAFGQASRQALVGLRPELDGIIPAAPSFPIELPTERIPDLGGFRGFLQKVVPTLTLLALGGATLALTVTSNRPAVLRRGSYWAFGASAGVLIFAFGIPALARRFAPDQAEVVAAFIAALAESTRGPAVGLAVAGGALLAGSFVWKAAPGVAGMFGDDDPGGRVGPVGGRPVRQAAPPTRVQASPTRITSETPVSTSRQSARPTYQRPPDGPAPSGSSAQPVHRPPRTSYPPRPPEPVVPAGSSARWVEGHGWVVDPGVGEIPDNAKWVPGVGYVVERGTTD